MRRIGAAGAVFFLWSLMAFSFPSPALPAALSPAAKSEIEHLLAHIERCGCQFYRNGTWYRDAKAVRRHVELKYDYFLSQGRIGSAEDFIKLCASKSEMSGKPYMVKCGDGSPSLLGPWLSDELDRLRKGE